MTWRSRLAGCRPLWRSGWPWEPTTSDAWYVSVLCINRSRGYILLESVLFSMLPLVSIGCAPAVLYLHQRYLWGAWNCRFYVGRATSRLSTSCTAYILAGASISTFKESFACANSERGAGRQAEPPSPPLLYAGSEAAQGDTEAHWASTECRTGSVVVAVSNVRPGGGVCPCWQRCQACPTAQCCLTPSPRF